jgi:hypothetical protein
MPYFVEYTEIDDPLYTVKTLGPFGATTARKHAKALSRDDNIYIAYVVDERRCGCIAYSAGKFLERDGAYI